MCLTGRLVRVCTARAAGCLLRLNAISKLLGATMVSVLWNWKGLSQVGMTQGWGSEGHDGCLSSWLLSGFGNHIDYVQQDACSEEVMAWKCTSLCDCLLRGALSIPCNCCSSTAALIPDGRFR